MRLAGFRVGHLVIPVRHREAAAPPYDPCSLWRLFTYPFPATELLLGYAAHAIEHNIPLLREDAPRPCLSCDELSPLSKLLLSAGNEQQGMNEAVDPIEDFLGHRKSNGHRERNVGREIPNRLVVVDNRLEGFAKIVAGRREGVWQIGHEILTFPPGRRGPLLWKVREPQQTARGAWRGSAALPAMRAS